MAQILVVKPKTLTAADKKLLREAGVVCVEAADASSVRLLSAEGPALDSTDLFTAAIKAIHKHGDYQTCRTLAAELAAAAVRELDKRP